MIKYLTSHLTSAKYIYSLIKYTQENPPKVNIVDEKYRGVILTSEGEKIARAIINRHESLTKFFKLFGLYDDIIYDDIEGIEHHMSPPTLATIQALTEELKKQPALLSRVKSKVFQAT